MSCSDGAAGPSTTIFPANAEEGTRGGTESLFEYFLNRAVGRMRRGDMRRSYGAVSPAEPLS